MAGIFDPQRRTSHGMLTEMVATMASTLHHRGPDDSGIWVDASSGIGLGHRRLSVIDLSSAGAQPMPSPSGRYVISYNGEVYNFRELRKDLERRGVGFRGTSDTEVLSAGLDVWGMEGTLSRLNGMFAFASWDRQRQELSLARDRFGEKPLYWGWVGGRLLFGSELRAVAAVSPDLPIDPQAVADLLAYKCVQAPRSIYQAFSKLRPGHFAIIKDHGQTETRCYWSASEVAIEAVRDPMDIDAGEAAEELAQRLERTVSSRMVADVPVGAFLSGGIDSAGIAAMMVRATSAHVRTFTVGLDDERYDESAQAATVARRLGTDHHPLRVTPEDVLELIPRISDVYDEPFADSSQIPTLLVSRLAAEKVKVALTGDGGDEIFGGYNRHVFGDRLASLAEAVPRAVRRPFGNWLVRQQPGQVDRWFARIAPALPERLRIRLPADKLNKAGRLLAAAAPSDAYWSLVKDVASDRLSATSPAPHAASDAWTAAGLAFGQRAMLEDTGGYLSNDVLVKVDRAAMSVSLETRAPYLDHDLFAWSWRLPHELRVSGGVGKLVLRKAVSEALGELDIPQAKSGFGVPLDEWLRGPLRPWAEDLVRVDDDFVASKEIRSIWQDHLTRRHDHTHELWSVLMFRSWLASRRTASSSVARFS